MKITKSEALALIEYNSFLEELHSAWTPYAWQDREIQRLFHAEPSTRLKYLQLDIARKMGKTELCCYFLWRRAMEKPRLQYYITESEENASHVIWNDKRLQNFGPRKYLLDGKSGIKESDHSIHFKNGSSIYLKGCASNIDSLLGTRPNGVVYDEFRTHNPKFHQVMAPNYIVWPDFQLLIASTPPWLDDVESGVCKFYRDMIEECETEPRKKYISIPCWEHSDPRMIDEYKSEQQRYERRGEKHAFEREYEVKYVRNVKDFIFPEMTDSLPISHNNIKQRIESIINKEYVVMVDPSGAKRWGALFGIIDLDNPTLYLVDSIILDNKNPRDRELMSVGKFWPLICAKMKDTAAQVDKYDWHKGYDCAEPWFPAEVEDQFDEDSLFGVDKKVMSVTEGYSLIKDLVKCSKIIISERCRDIIHEFQGLQINPNTENPYKGQDELIACLRYILHEFNYLFKPSGLKVFKHYKDKLDYLHQNFWEGMKNPKKNTDYENYYIEGE